LLLTISSFYDEVSENINSSELIKHNIKAKHYKKYNMIKKQLFGILTLVTGLSACSNNGNNNSADTYQEKVQSVAEIENSQPTNFLSASGTYNTSFFGNNLKVHGLIKNTATVATYKDAVVKVTYYSKTKTILGSNNYIIYDFFPPSSEKPFELKIDNYQNVNSIGWDVVKATPNE
jgi:hypothetical protein